MLFVGIGLIAGCIIGGFTRYALHICIPHAELLGRNALGLLNELEMGSYEMSRRRRLADDDLVLIGVMTAKKFVGTRALAAQQTWVKSIPGKVIFFSSEGSEKESPPGLPVIGLKNVDDSYPPQKKSFMMLKYMHDHFLNKFKFFMRADDDLYIKGEILGQLLYSINDSRALFLGQAGLGNKDEFGLLHLNSSENFCMGGTGIILSRRTLSLMVPHVRSCIKNMYTTHEDVEIGRCVSKFAKVSCTWAYEMQKIFYNNYREPKGSFTHSLKDQAIHNAATLHPVKNSSYQHRIHTYFISLKVSKLRNRLSKLQREVNAMNDELQDRDEFYSPVRYGLPASLLKTIPRNRDEVLSWDFFSKSAFSAKNLNPRRGLEADQKTGFEDNVVQVMEMINRNSRQRGRAIDFKEILYGYNRVNPLHGADYILDLLLVYKKFKGKRRMTVPVRRHAYLQQAFLEVEFREDDLTNVPLPEVATVMAAEKSATDSHRPKRGFSELPNVRVNLILPLSGRYKTFLQFIHNFEDVCLKNAENVSLVIMLYPSEQDDRSEETISYIRNLQEKYPEYKLRVISGQGAFARGVALQHGSSLYADHDLLFFIDVDMYVRRDTLQRIRLNAIEGRSVYYPVVFSQYDPQLVCEKDNSSVCSPKMSPFVFDMPGGYWRNFGFGIVALTNSDLRQAGGFDLNIKGWGKEDVALVDKFIFYNVSVFRSVDTGLVHIFHSIVCDPNLDPAQYQMCLGSKAASYASTEKLASFVFQTPEIFRRNEQQPAKAVPEVNAFQDGAES